ncbi:hypothetical protein KKC97_03085 [bacterium]|nr:hypothetical protein [bacterium]MBU1921208.1 hypothetical protein [bacterium]
MFGLMLFIYLVLSLLLLLVSWIRAKRKEERNISRWLLLCTVIGVAPFVIMHKLPTLWSSTPLISIDLAMMFLIVSPIGWGMAVASFKLLPIERTLSRTFIYVTAGTIAVYGVLILISFGMVDVEYNILSLIALSIAAVFVTFLAGFTLVKGIRGVVDRIYFGDWYSFRDELQRISKKLASSIVEREIVVIITEQLPDILKIDKAILVVRETDQAWKPVVQRDLPLASEFEENLRSLNHLVDKEAHDAPIGIPANDTLLVWGIEVILPLVHANQIMGCLLLGRKETHAPYSIRDFQLLQTISSFAGIAIANLELHRELVERECRAVAADLAGGISHEINNALYPLKGQAQLLQHMLVDSSDKTSQEKIASSVKMISEMSDRIQRISDNLNHLSEPIKLQKCLFNLNEIAEEAIVMLNETAGRIKKFKTDDPNAPYKLVRSFQSDLPKVEADPGQLNQVFINLIINAADAMNSEMSGVLTVGTFQSADKEIIGGFVEDTGVGIPPEKIKEVIQPYFTTKTEGKGTGLGLAIVNSIIEGHQGKLNILSEPGGGTRVEFMLPV